MGEPPPRPHAALSLLAVSPGAACGSLFRGDDRRLALRDAEAVAAHHVERLHRERAVRPAYRDLGAARRAQVEVLHEIVLLAIVAEAAGDFGGARQTVGRRDRDARANGGAGGARPAFQRE